MKSRYRHLLITLLVAIFGICMLMVFGLGAVVGKYRPALAKPYSDWALALVLPLQQVGCNVDDVTRCGVTKTDRPAVSCTPFTASNPRHAILFTFGQSNSANFGETRYTATQNVVNFNIHDGKCYPSADPLLGADGDGGSAWGRLGDQLIASGAFDRVLIVPFGIGGTALHEWTTGGRLHPRVKYTAQQLNRAGIAPTHVLWHQGENDARIGTASSDYIRMFTALVQSLRDYGIEAPVFPAIASICDDKGSDAIRSAQRALPEHIAGVHLGPDTDSLSDMRDRFDYCHFSERGLQAHAQLWSEVILSFEQGR
jgi:Carbohydrate esterase, sialic acid-specific acetylesterase